MGRTGRRGGAGEKETRSGRKVDVRVVGRSAAEQCENEVIINIMREYKSYLTCKAFPDVCFGKCCYH